MNKYLLSAIGAALLILIGIWGWAGYQVGSLAKDARPVVTAAVPLVENANKTISSLTGVLDQLQSAVAYLGRSCGEKDPQKGLLPCGTLADVAKTLNTIRGAFGQIEVAAIHENRNLTNLDAQEKQLFSDVHSSLDQFIALEVQLNSTVGNIQGLEDKLGLVLDSTHKTITDVDTIVTDQELIDLIQHANNISDHLDGLTGDIQTKTHELIYPEPCHGKVCWVKRSYKIVRGVVQLGEPTYYWGRIIQNFAPQN
ncbi:MAG: hypothetical protein KGL39_58955 [Patescibacteria group bacterium]|nr:hypothetical protein [Patescibacteria group bacterium]